MAKTWKLFKGKSVFHGPEPPKHPTPCTRWGRRPSSTRARLSFGPGRHPRTRNTPKSGFSLGQEGDDVLLNLKGFHHGSVPSERLTVLVEQNLLPVPANVLLGHGRVKQKVCVFKEGWYGRGASAQSPLVQGDSRCSVDIRSGKQWESWLKAIARPHMANHISNFSRIPRWLLIEELGAGNSKDFHLILVYLLQCIEVRVLGGKASVGSHIGQQNHFA